MKAAVREKYGSPDVVRLEDVDRPVPADHQVLVRVHAASVNRADLDNLTPRPSFVRLFIGLRAPRNPRIGLDVAGVVEAIGPSVTLFRPGDRVFADLFAFGQGAFAEYVCAPEKAFALMATGMTFEDAATLPHSAILALQGLRLRNGRTIRPGNQVLIDGASGNVGPFAVQVAKSMGAVVTGVCSTDMLEFVRSLGADLHQDGLHERWRALRLDPRHRLPPFDPSHPARAATERRLRHARRDVNADSCGFAARASDLESH
jgi:NADPH:quinone reductase-like Zn-dependent oxidoreductase